MTRITSSHPRRRGRSSYACCLTVSRRRLRDVPGVLERQRRNVGVRLWRLPADGLQFNAVRPNDAIVIAAVAALLAAVAILASLRPAIRATVIDPPTALRQE